MTEVTNGPVEAQRMDPVQIRDLIRARRAAAYARNGNVTTTLVRTVDVLCYEDAIAHALFDVLEALQDQSNTARVDNAMRIVRAIIYGIAPPTVEHGL